MFGLTSPLTDVCTCYRIEYAPEKPEWQQEKHRFYVELPGNACEIAKSRIA